ncbi:MAG TPA: FG-GAP-like repeat-containing protein [Pyrinomonadaceae bacterium]|jgi:alpha-tubulin suppressor-like RCC1 family protein
MKKEVMKKSRNLFLLLAQFATFAFLISGMPSILNAQVKVWGDNQYGQLGTGNYSSYPVPTTLSGLNDIIDIAAGASTTIALRRNGTLLSWGKNQYGLLGTGSTEPAQSNVPVQVVNLTGVVSVEASGRAAMALKSDGTVWVWGNNYYCQFGNGTQGGQLESNPTPVQVTGLPNIVAISINQIHALALDSQGRIWGWGENTSNEINYEGGLRIFTPELVPGFPAGTTFTSISTSSVNSVALTANGEVYVWGDNQQGQDGAGRCNFFGEVVGQPKRVITSGVSQIAASEFGVGVLLTNGSVQYWGKNDYSQAGNNTTSVCTAPVNASISNVTDLRAGDIHFLARKTDGAIWGWGYNVDCEIGNGSCSVNERVPVQTQAGAGNSRIFEAGGRTGFVSNARSASRPFDFDGDSKTDVSIFRPSAGEWWYLKSSTGGNAALAFGTSTDKLAPGDFTGDGKTDIAFWRPGSGFWFILRSEDNSFFSFPFGASEDIPAPSDYDGDGKTDAAVFRPSSGTWFILNSSGSGTSIVNFGSSEDKPVAADFDGDGRADIAIFRPSDGSWWYLQSSNSQFKVYRFGVGTDKPVQGDYTGDGKADIAIFRPSTGEWYFQRSEDNSYYSFVWGASGDIPAPGDYDGDGRADAAVFRPSNTTWYMNQTTAGVGIVNFGSAGDKPVPNAFVP